MDTWIFTGGRDSCKTQKALSIYDLNSHNGEFPCTDHFPSGAKILPQHISTIPTIYPLFARPCPLTPRHGFVDSRPVHSQEEALALLEEVKREDPEGELILMPILTGKYSAVATNVGVTWGHGNDGVTGGKGENILIPTPTTQVERWNYYTHLSLKIPDAAYLELVEHNGHTIVVQVRNGPALPNTPDYIPRTEVVNKVFRPDGYSLLTWERLLKDAVMRNGGKPDGLAICSQGMALSSHYAVHGVELGIPVITSRGTKVGDQLGRVESTTPELTQADYDNLAALIRAWELKNYITPEGLKCNSTILTAIATIHTMQQWGNTPHLQQLRASSIISLLRYLSAATLGEMRYWWTQGPGRDGGSPLTDLDSKLSSKDRDQIYTNILKPAPIHTILGDFKTTRKDFNTYSWRGQVGRRGRDPSTYGGRKWGNVSNAGLNLAEATLAFLSSPSKQTWAEVTITANTAVHTAHNNGFALNKWISGNIFKKVAECPGLGFLNSFAGQIALGMDIKVEEENEDE